jgi:hypothetical protein
MHFPWIWNDSIPKDNNTSNKNTNIETSEPVEQCEKIGGEKDFDG